MPIVQPMPADRLCVVGSIGTGKSYRAARYLEGVRRVVLWQPMADWSLGHIESVDDFESRIEEYRSGALRVTIDPTTYSRAGLASEYERMCAACYEIGALTFVTEEPGLVMDANDAPDELVRLAIRGRHRAVSMVTIGQRFAQFPVIVRGTANRLWSFRQTDPIDVKAVYSRMSPYELPVDPAQLPDRTYLEWTPAGVELQRSR